VEVRAASESSEEQVVGPLGILFAQFEQFFLAQLEHEHRSFEGLLAFDRVSGCLLVALEVHLKLQGACTAQKNTVVAEPTAVRQANQFQLQVLPLRVCVEPIHSTGAVGDEKEIVSVLPRL